jgi:SAM-dependent methyltransferase
MNAMPMWDHRWIAKAVAQKTMSKLGLLPVYHVGQRFLGRLKHFDPRDRLQYAGKLAADVGLDRLNGARVVEIGTGWVPVVPMGLHVLGAASIETFDLSRHLQPKLSAMARDALPDCMGELAQRSGAPLTELQSRLRKVPNGDWSRIAHHMRIAYRAPDDFRYSGLPSASVDIVYSNLVLEHIPPHLLAEILAECRRILKPGGVCWHNVDFTDHYSHTFKSLSPVNFLRYGRKLWDFASNDILYMNRMRHIDYVRTFDATGFAVAKEHCYLMEDEPMIGRVHRDFEGYSDEEIRCMACRFVLIAR